MSETTFRLALAGNPNSGKSSIFNYLTGLRQKVGNFPGVTVDRKVGPYKLPNGTNINLIDFPGAYSFYPTAQDERVVVETLVQPLSDDFPNAVLYVADITRLEKHLLLFTQLQDLNLPIALVLNMADMAAANGRSVDSKKLSNTLQAPVLVVSSHTGEGMNRLPTLIHELVETNQAAKDNTPFYQTSPQEQVLTSALASAFPAHNDYQRLLLAHHADWLSFLSATEQETIQAAREKAGFKALSHQVEETMARYDKFTPIVQRSIQQSDQQGSQLTAKVDRWLTHPVLGPIIFLTLMLLVFQAIYAWAEYPMGAIEWVFGAATDAVKAILPTGWVSDLITDGILAGLGGIVVFVPQIAILFFLITLLEEVGYMARAAFMFDRVMQAVGLNGRSLVALISSGACAIPAIMSTRTIANWKERLITIMVAPFISCAARIPVYIVLIGLVVPNVTVGGIFNAQGLVFMGLYLLGIAAALLTALAMKYIVKSNERSFLMLEMPEYRQPLLRNVGLTVWEKVRAFVVEAGKVILVISMILWALASYGPANDMADAESRAATVTATQSLTQEESDNLVASYRLEASYAGHLGKWIEPVIRPLGFDWKMGIAIISSFAAREVFVGTMATLYSVGSEDESTVRERLANEVDPDTGEAVYNFATALSLLLFYVFAMMCMSTLAVVRRETGSWRWPIIQFLLMTGIAYLSSLLVYQWLQ